MSIDEINELAEFRRDFLRDARSDSVLTKDDLLQQALPYILDAKLVESEDYNSSAHGSSGSDIKIDGYSVSDSRERLQLFVVDDESIDHKSNEIIVTEKSMYEQYFKRGIQFATKAFHGKLKDELQASSPVGGLVSLMSSNEGKQQFDVVEVFLLTYTITGLIRGDSQQTKNMYFKDESFTISYKEDDEVHTKDILLKRHLININRLYSIQVSRGQRIPLKVNFDKLVDEKVEVLIAANEDKFESYLCVLSGTVIANLYKAHGSRLLEKNVRSFLQFRGVNGGIRETIRKEPSRFIAYNNGLTITAVKAETRNYKKRTYLQSLTDFQIVNGGQTTASIYFSMKDGLDISKVRIMAKINVAKELPHKDLEELISNISKFSNSQSKVSNVDIRSRNPALMELKRLSDTVVAPNDNKWFFERAKGEFATRRKRMGVTHSKFEKLYPKERRFSKELLAKYFSSWGDTPYLVKKGGEKIFRHFIEKVSNEDENSKSVKIDIGFYENTIAKILLFRRMENLYGQGKNAIGQLRSAVIPYVLSVLYIYSDAKKKPNPFNFAKIWKEQKLDPTLEMLLVDLMQLMNKLIKNYSLSDDLGEYSKKEELWIKIKRCEEISTFMSGVDARLVLQKYSTFQEEYLPAKEYGTKNEVLSSLLKKHLEKIHQNLRIDFYEEDLKEDLISRLEKQSWKKLEDSFDPEHRSRMKEKLKK